MTTKIASTHSLQRTSPKGVGKPFIGFCTLCGKRDLPITAAAEYCENPMGLSDNQVIADLVKGPEK